MSQSEAVVAAEIAGEFPGWEAWHGIDRLWHARMTGETPPVMVWGESPADLRDQIRRRVYQEPETRGIFGSS